jgi:ornithine decarboxylase antizyme 1
MPGLCIAPDVDTTQTTNKQLPSNANLVLANQYNPNVANSLEVSNSSHSLLNRFIKPRNKLVSESSSIISSSSSEGSLDDLNESSSCNKKAGFDDFDEIADNADSLLLDFQYAVSVEKQVEWRTLFLNNILYVDIPQSVLPDGSRDSFVSLLEFAEDKLGCHKVFVCFKRNRVDRAALMRVFMFLGFTIVSPDSKEVPQNEEIMSMVYTIE